MKFLLMLYFLFMIASPSNSDDSGVAKQPAASKGENLLNALPSKLGPHTEKIKIMEDNSWLNIGQAASDEKWGVEGVARGRAWCSKMAYAKNLGGAFFCGTGVHGYVKSNGHYMDDLWFYDANAHKWICLYPGADKNTKLHLDSNGLEIDEDGNHIPVSYLSHAYNNVTYNSDLRKYHIMWTQCPWWGKAVPQRWDWLGIPEEKRTYGNSGAVIPTPKHPLFWDVTAGKWDRKFVTGSGPNGRFEGIAEYIPSLQKTLYLHQGVFWTYDYSENTWATGPKAPALTKGGYDSNGCYDPKTDRIYVAGGKSFAYFDIKTNTWVQLEAKNQPENLLSTNSSQLFFDTANDVVLWHQTNGPIFIYNPTTNDWVDLGNTTPEITGHKSMCVNGFYNVELNAYFFYMAGDSNLKNATMLVYRYKNPTKELK